MVFGLKISGVVWVVFLGLGLGVGGEVRFLVWFRFSLCGWQGIENLRNTNSII